MKKEQAEQVKLVVEEFLEGFCNGYDKTLQEDAAESGIEPEKMDRMFVVEVKESCQSPNWWGVEIRTDGDVYDAIYAFNKFAEINQAKMMKAVNEHMHWNKGEHYIERYGQGILELY